MSNNPPLPEPPVDMSDLEATIFTGSPPGAYRVGDEELRAPLVTDEQIRELKPQGRMAPPIKNRARPRRGPQREPIFHRDDYRAAIIIIALSFPVGFLGAVLGILLMSHT